MLIFSPTEAGGWSVAALVAAALLLDRLIGDPPGLYRLVPHPVAAIGNLVDYLDRLLNRDTDPPPRKASTKTGASDGPGSRFRMCPRNFRFPPAYGGNALSLDHMFSSSISLSKP